MESTCADQAGPEKAGALCSIGELARASGLTVSALRFYDSAGLLVPVWVDPSSSYRWYGPDQLRAARLLARLRRVGMPLAELRLVVAGWADQDTTLILALLDAHLRRLEDGLDDARRELSTVRELLALRERPMTQSHTGTTAGPSVTTPAAPAPTPAATPTGAIVHGAIVHGANSPTPASPSSTASSVTAAPSSVQHANTPARLSLNVAELAAALDSVRFAVGSAPELPMLSGVLFDLDTEARSLRLVATDRYRMAVSHLAVPDVGGAASREAIVPTPLVDAMRALLTCDDITAVLTMDVSAEGRTVGLEVGGSRVAGTCLDHDFPDYRRLTRGLAGRRVTVDVPALREALNAGPTQAQQREQDGVDFDISVLAVSADGGISVVAGEAQADGSITDPHIGVNREFLLDALAVTARDQLVLELGGPISPLAVRIPGREHSFSLLMPVRLTQQAGKPHEE